MTKINVVVGLGRKSEDIESNSKKVTDWLDQRQDIEKWKAGSLFDIWHGDFDEIEDESEQFSVGYSWCQEASSE